MKKKFKGAVLITVLLIMAVIIILTASALAITLSIHQRTMNKYADNQAYFSARSALNSTLACIQNYTGTEDDEYVKLAKQVRALADGSTGDYFTATTEIETPPLKGSGIRNPVILKFENIDEDSNLIKLTATTKVGQSGNASVAVVFYMGEYVPSNNFSNALTTLGGASGVNISAYGGSALNLKKKSNDTIVLSNDGKIVGPVNINGSAITSTQTVYELANGDYFVCLIDDGASDQPANLTINNPTAFCGYQSDKSDSSERPYIYVSGNVDMVSNGLVGYNGTENTSEISAPVDLHCNTLTGYNNLKINGDLYIHGNSSDVANMFNSGAGSSFGFTSIDITGNIYFDDEAAANEFQSEISLLIEFGSLPYVKINNVVLEGSIVDVQMCPDNKTKENMQKTVPNAFNVMEGFVQKDTDGNMLFDTDGTPLLNEVTLPAANADALSNYWNSSQNAYIINTGDSDLINIDLSLDAMWGGTAYIDKPVIIDGTGICNMFLPENKHCVIQNRACILTRELYDQYLMGSFNPLKFESGEGSISSPNINFFLADGSTLEESNNCVISGYIYGPNAKFVGMGVSCSDIIYDNVDCGMVNGISVIGSIICGEMSSGGNNFLAIYIPPKNNGDDDAFGADGSNISFKYYSR